VIRGPLFITDNDIYLVSHHLTSGINDNFRGFYFWDFRGFRGQNRGFTPGDYGVRVKYYTLLGNSLARLGSTLNPGVPFISFIYY